MSAFSPSFTPSFDGGPRKQFGAFLGSGPSFAPVPPTLQRVGHIEEIHPLSDTEERALNQRFEEQWSDRAQSRRWESMAGDARVNQAHQSYSTLASVLECRCKHAREEAPDCQPQEMSSLRRQILDRKTARDQLNSAELGGLSVRTRRRKEHNELVRLDRIVRELEEQKRRPMRRLG
eukprot:TRINITY_DN28998_c0_g1_i3.p1 TRINITY_DN28998_c0_g1~~TRINITY_DN28998_c0_g1_i3.p1  ORF type:complete len:177 (+),score=31.54 TRINITY_DN28998_c0_g1_i3:200-730(+)